MDKLIILDYEMNTKLIHQNDYIFLTDIAKKDTIDYLGLWENIYNSHFNRIEFDVVKMQVGHNRFTMSPKKWIRSVNVYES